jgi:hypothetical protein
VSEGIVSSVRQVDGVGPVLQVTAAISPGSSGSPVFNSRGEVVGVATLQFRGEQALNFAVGVEAIRKLRAGPERPLAAWSTGDVLNAPDPPSLQQLSPSVRDFIQRVAASNRSTDILESIALGKAASLKGLPGVAVLIEDLGEGVEEAGLRRDHLSVTVELRLRAAGIRILNEKEKPLPPGAPTLYLNVNALPRGRLMTYAVRVNLLQNVYLEGSGRHESWAATWDVGYVGVDDAEGIRSQVRDLIDRFCNDFLKANPK